MESVLIPVGHLIELRGVIEEGIFTVLDGLATKVSEASRVLRERTENVTRAEARYQEITEEIETVAKAPVGLSPVSRSTRRRKGKDSVEGLQRQLEALTRQAEKSARLSDLHGAAKVALDVIQDATTQKAIAEQALIDITTHAVRVLTTLTVDL